MRYMDASSNIMVPVATCSGFKTSEGLSQSTSKLPLPTCDSILKNGQNGIKQSFFLPNVSAPVHFLPENNYSFKSWSSVTKESPNDKRRENSYYSNFKSKHPSDETIKIKKNLFPSELEDTSDLFVPYNKNYADAFPQSFFSCQLPDVLMNGADKHTMTGSSNPQSDQLNWLSEVASATVKGTLNKQVSNPNQNDQLIALPPVLHTVGDGTSQLLLSNSGSVFSSPLVVARPAGTNSLKMFTPPFQVERTRHIQQTSIPVSGTMYYTQAPRTNTLPNFFQATYPPTISQSNVNIPNNNSDSTRTYLQVNNYSPLSTTHVSSSQLSSASYLQHQPTSSPANLAVHSSHSRMFQQGRSILISQSPETMSVQPPHERDLGHVQIQLSPTLSQSQDETHRKSYTSTDSVLGSSSCSPVETAQIASQNTDFPISQQRISPSGYRLPTGKEGSLKHRILRPPSINILDPPNSIVADAPLSAPPIRTREPSPKQARSIPSSGYRSFSSSASSITEISSHVIASPGGTFPNNCSSVSSGCPSPNLPNSPGTAQLKYPQSFMKGAIIQLANNKLKQVEDMTTEDFIECGMLSSTLKIDSSTVVNIERIPFTGAAKLSFHVGQDNIQITVEAPLEHPFFVYKQGWSSCSPERSAQRYGLTCHKLKVGDVCISLTDKPRSTTSSGQKEIDNSVPTVNVSNSNQNTYTDRTFKTKEGVLDVMHLPSNVNSPSEKMKASQCDINKTCTGKRKRRWSAPDNLSQSEDGIPSS